MKQASSVMQTYARFNINLVRGSGSEVWDSAGKRYLDFAGGIAVNSLGHAHPAIVSAIAEQAATLMHTSNLYHNDLQEKLAERLVDHFGHGGGSIFFCNSGAEANEGLYKFARRTTGRSKILTATNSFHGRTLGGLSATGQEKVKKGFYPMVQGLGHHVPFNDAEAVRKEMENNEIAAVLIEGVQGEGGLTPATPEYLLELRRLCDDHGALLMVDGVQCGHFRTGTFQSYTRILEEHSDEEFAPDACSMAKSLGGGFPMGAVWTKDADALPAGSHGTTFGGSHLACAVGNAVLDVIEEEHLADNARHVGDWLRDAVSDLAKDFPDIIVGPKGLGLMQGIQCTPEYEPGILVEALHDIGALTVGAGKDVVRMLPALNISAEREGAEFIDKLRQACVSVRR